MIGPVVLALWLTACAGGTDSAAPVRPATGSPSAGSPTPVPPAVDGSAGAGVVHSSAMLQPADVGGAEVEQPSEGSDRFLRPPRPCGKGGPSDALRIAAARNHYLIDDPALIGEPRPSDRLFELVMVFREGGSGRYMTELADEVRSCPQSAEYRWFTVEDGAHLRFTVNRPIEYGTGNRLRQDVPVLVTRIGEAVVVLAALGYEASGGSPALLTNVVARAEQRAGTAG